MRQVQKFKEGYFQKMFSRILLAFFMVLLFAFWLGTTEVFSQCLTPPSGMAGWWPLDEIGGPTAFDIAGVANNGTYHNGPTPVAGKVAGGLLFDGINDYVDAADHPELNFGTGSFSIDAWVRIDSLTFVNMAIVWKGSSTGATVTSPYSLAVFGTNNVSDAGKIYAACSNGSTSQFVISTFAPTLGQFVHVAVISDGSNIKLYINGVLNNSNAWTQGVPNPNVFPLQIGGLRTSGVNSFKGVIDELEMFNRALTATEVGNIFAAGSSGKCKPCQSGAFDLKISSIQQTVPAKRGARTWTLIFCKNIGNCASPPATLVCTGPPQVPRLLASSWASYPPYVWGNAIQVPLTYNLSAKTATWTLPPIVPGGEFYLWATYDIPCALATGTPLTATASISPTAGDANPANNTGQVTIQAAAGAPPCNTPTNASSSVKALSALADGNKFSLPVGGVSGLDMLTYLVAFQNVGSGTVTDVVIRDTLDVNLDEATLESVGYSSPPTFSISGREITLTFSGLNLPDSATNDTGSIGFVAYRIKPQANTPVATEIKNSSLIYFDSNPPLATDTVSNYICAGAKGDMNGDMNLTSSDVILMLNCAFLGSGGCDLCFADVNCDASLTSTDVVLELNRVFLGQTAPPWCGN